MYTIESKSLKLNFSSYIEKEEYLYSQLDENFSDICYELLLGTRENQFKKIENCSTNADCFSYYTTSNTSKYYLTHQLLFFIISKQVIGLNFIVLKKYLFFIFMKYYKTLCLDKVIVQLKEYLINNNQNKNIQYSLNLPIPEVSNEESLFNYFCEQNQIFLKKLNF